MQHINYVQSGCCVQELHQCIVEGTRKQTLRFLCSSGGFPDRYLVPNKIRRPFGRRHFVWEGANRSSVRFASVINSHTYTGIFHSYSD